MQDSNVQPDVVVEQQVSEPITGLPRSDHEHEIVDTALAAIDTLLNASMWVLSVLAFVLAVIAIFGWTVIRRASVERATKVAGEKLDEFLSTEDFESLLSDKIQEAIERKWQGGLFINVDAAGSGTNDSPFPEPKTEEPAKVSNPRKES